MSDEFDKLTIIKSKYGPILFDRQDKELELMDWVKSKYGPIFFDRQGKELELMDWGHKCEDADYRIVKKDRVGKYFVSTLWFGFNMGSFRDIPPLIFETMIFMDIDDQDDEFYFYQKTYSTEKEALMGHEEVLSLVKNHIASITPPLVP